MNIPKEEYTILAYKLHSKVNPDQGDIRPIAKIVGDEFIELDANNFCHTRKVFVTAGYQNIDEKFKEGQIFRTTVNLAEYISSNIDPNAASKYITQGIKAERLKPNELIEVIDGDLPERNKRYFENNNGQYPRTEYIFIRDQSNECFGPFAWEHKEDDSGFSLELLNDKPLLKSYNISLGQVFKITTEKFNEKLADHSVHQFNSSFEDRTYCFVSNIHEFIDDAERDEYASDEEIVRYCAKLAGEMGKTLLSKANWDDFKKIASTHPVFDQELSKNRLLQLSTLASEIFIIQDEIHNNIEPFLRSHYGEQLIDRFISRKKPQLLDDLRKEVIQKKDKDIEEKEEKISQIEQILKAKEKERLELSAEVERRRNEANQDVILKNALAERDEQIKKLDAQITEKQKLLNELLEKHSLSDRLDTIKNEIQVQENIYDRQRKKNDSLEAITKDLQNEYNTSEDKLRSKLILYKPYIDAVNGSFIVDKREKRSVFVETNTVVHSDNFEQKRLIVETVKQNLRLKGRFFESWQVANFLISTQQSFITFLAGLPGVGKTSLARLIVESQQLEPRLQEVSVARGWTSQKDLIGFYNPLSNHFQSANTGLYTFIEALSSEKNEPAMAYVLLDEANLSPIEHYWSAFMAMADGEGARELRLGQDTLTVPTVLRFMATINYDGTTEPLSPRVVDRAPVLVMEPNDALIEDNETLAETAVALPLSAIEMDRLFGLAENIPLFADEEEMIFKKVRKILSDPSLEKGRPLSISQRKEIVIRQYCAQASSLMRSFGCDDFKALDLAILQHVLPQVRGSGQKFAKRLSELKQLCDDEGLNDSANYLERMLVYGESELHSYDFFCW